MSYMTNNTVSGGSYQSGWAGEFDRVDRLLHTENGFKRSLIHVNGADITVFMLVVFAIGSFGYNIYQTIKAIRNDGSGGGEFWHVFVAGQDEDSRLFGMGIPLLMTLFFVLVALIIWLLRRMKRNSTLTKLYDEFCRSGFLTELVPTGVTVPLGTRLHPVVYVFGAPNVPAEWVAAAALRMQFATTYNPMDSQAEEYSKALLKLAKDTTNGYGQQLNKADPTIPPGLFVVAELSGGEMTPRLSLLRVALPKGDDFTKVSLEWINPRKMPTI